MIGDRIPQDRNRLIVGPAKRDKDLSRAQEDVSSVETTVDEVVTNPPTTPTTPGSGTGTGSGYPTYFFVTTATHDADPNENVITSAGSFINYTGRYIVAGDIVFVGRTLASGSIAAAAGVVGLKREGGVLYPPTLPILGGYALLTDIPYPFIASVFNPLLAIRDSIDSQGLGTNTYWSNETRHTLGSSSGVTEGNAFSTSNWSDPTTSPKSAICAETNELYTSTRVRSAAGTWSALPTVATPYSSTRPVLTTDLNVLRGAFPLVSRKRFAWLPTGATNTHALHILDGASTSSALRTVTLGFSVTPLVRQCRHYAWTASRRNKDALTDGYINDFRCYDASGTLLAAPSLSVPHEAPSFRNYFENVSTPAPNGSILVVQLGYPPRMAYVLRIDGTYSAFAVPAGIDSGVEILTALADNTWLVSVSGSGTKTKLYITDGQNWIPVFESTGMSGTSSSANNRPLLRVKVHNDGSGLWSFAMTDLNLTSGHTDGDFLYYEATWPYAAPHW